MSNVSTYSTEQAIEALDAIPAHAESVLFWLALCARLRDLGLQDESRDAHSKARDVSLTMP